MTKRIEAIVRHEKLPKLIDSLWNIGVRGITTSEVHGHGRNRGQSETHRGAEYAIDLVPRVLILTFVPDELVALTVETIAKTCHTGKIADGIISVSEIVQLIGIRIGELGDLNL